MQNWDKIKIELETLLNKDIEVNGRKAKIVTVATNEQKSNFYIGVFPVEDHYINDVAINDKPNYDWSKSLPEYADSGIFWIDKITVGNINSLSYLIQRFKI